jgi:hypothetical protein
LDHERPMPMGVGTPDVTCRPPHSPAVLVSRSVPMRRRVLAPFQPPLSAVVPFEVRRVKLVSDIKGMTNRDHRWGLFGVAEYRAFMVGVIIICAISFSLSACAAERKWAEGHAPRENVKFEADISTALRECVAAHDSEHLADLDQGHDYRERIAPVVQCMRKKGWLDVPATIYGPLSVPEPNSN